MKTVTKLLFFVALATMFGCSPTSTATGNNVPSHPVEVSSSVPGSRASATPAPSPSPEIRSEWKAKIGGINYAWTTRDLEVQNVGEVRNIFSRISKAYNKILLESPDNKECLAEHFFRLTSIVYGLISFEHEVSFSCGAVSSSVWRYTTMNVKRPGDYVYPRVIEFETRQPKRTTQSKMISLLDISSEKEILNGLLANQRIDRDIGRWIAEGKIAAAPKTLTEFSSIYANNMREAFGGYFYLESDYLTRFTFHHVDKGNVAVRISLSATSNTSNASQEYIEIVLHVPKEFREPVRLAEIGESGFLMKDAPKYVGTNFAEFEIGEK